MIKKLLEWSIKQKKDAQILLTCSIIVFVLNLIGTLNFFNALNAGFDSIFGVAVTIFAFRFWRGFIKKLIPKTIPIELCEEEKQILNEIIALPNLKELSTHKIDEIIKEKIVSKNYCKEDWQAHYAKERIKKLL